MSVSFSEMFHAGSTLLVLTSVTHMCMSPSLTTSLAIIVPTRSPSCEISKSQKSGHVTARVHCRDLTRLCAVPQTMYWSQTESSKWSLNCLSHDLRRPRKGLWSHSPTRSNTNWSLLTGVVVGWWGYQKRKHGGALAVRASCVVSPRYSTIRLRLNSN